MEVYYSAQMRNLDKIAEEQFDIPGIVLMENAALGCVREAEGFDELVIVCGKGNNGGDGLAIARHLINRGKNVRIYLAMGDDFSGDALINYKILQNMKAEFYDARETERLIADLKTAQCTVDAIFGTGMRGEVRDPVKRIIEAINEFSRYVLSVDVPSGINSDSGEVETVCVKADKTVTFAAYKAGLLLYPAADFTGEVICADISMPKAAFDIEKTDIKTLDSEYIKGIMPKRQANSQKGDYGKIFVIGGQKGMAGAVTMACRAAFKTGAGIVTACVPHEINDIVQIGVENAMTYPADFNKDIDKIIEKSQNFDVILFGNGIGRDDNTGVLLEKILEFSDAPVIIDADGLFLLSERPEMLKKRKCDVILTPHAMEMARLAGCSVGEVEKNRLSLSENFAKREGLTLVLKGNHSIITAPDGKRSVNMTGNSGMATAGSGDVLAGMTAGFLASCKDTVRASELAVYFHGLAGDLAAKQLSEYAVTAPDIINAIPHILPVEN